MRIWKKAVKYLTNAGYRFRVNNSHGHYHNMSDEEFLKKMFRYKIGYPLNLTHPQTFNEKLQWLKLYDRNPLYTKLVDKYAVKEYVAKKIGKQYIIPTINVWDSEDEIEFDSLPQQFVLKCTHDSHGLVICKDKSQLDIPSAKMKLSKGLKRNYFWLGREWPYKNVKPRIIAEQFMEDQMTGELRDYKFFCFNGEVKMLFIASERQSEVSETKFDFFDTDFNHLAFTNGHPNADPLPEKPLQFELMKELASKLSVDIPHVRVDFYEVDGKVYFGEMTFYHWSGFTPFDPPEWDMTIGSWIRLPQKKDEENVK